MKHKLKFTITKIRRQTTESSYFNRDEVCIAETEKPADAESIAFFDIENPIVTNPMTDGKIHPIRTASENLPDNPANLTMMNVRKKSR